MVTGAVQVPPDGRPIVLMPDHATVGGYPVVATVIGADLGVLGQLAPGEHLRFLLVDRPSAVAAARRKEEGFGRPRPGLVPDATGHLISSTPGPHVGRGSMVPPKNRAGVTVDETRGTDDEQSDDEALSSDPSDVQAFEPETGSYGLANFPVSPPDEATPLDEDEHGGPIPPASLWAMKDRRHEQLPHPFGHPSRLRASAGAGDAAVYAIDDGLRHCMIGRRVGATRDGATYTLVARVPRKVYDDLATGAINGRHAFLEAKEAALIGTGEEPGMANVFDVDFYRHPSDIPDEYLPPAPFIEFAEDLPSADR